MKNRIAILMVAAVVLVMALSACGAVKGLSAVNDKAEAFMATLRDGDATTSWNMLTTAVKDEVGSEEGWVEFITPRNFSEWKFTNTQIENDVAQVDGTATLGEDTYDIVLVFDLVDDVWMVSGINITFKE